MEESYFPDINRAAVIVTLKKPFIDWLVYTSREFDGDDLQIKAEEIETTGFDSKHVAERSFVQAVSCVAGCGYPYDGL